jgi:hypothetical protein
MKALVIQVSEEGFASKTLPMVGVATAPPVKLSGNTRAARQIAARTE